MKQKQLRVVQVLPRIGPERAEKLLEKLGTVRKVFQAPVTELLSIEAWAREP